MISQSLAFWTLVAGALAYLAKFFLPSFPLDTAGILAVILFVLGLIGVVPQVRLMGATFKDLLKSMAFWQIIAGLVWFVAHYYFPTFPLDEVGVLAFVIFILGMFQIDPELRVRGLKN